MNREDSGGGGGQLKPVITKGWERVTSMYISKSTGERKGEIYFMGYM